MPFYKIKENFLEFVSTNNYCKEIMNGNKERGHFFLVAIRNKEFLVPLRTERKHRYIYEVQGGVGCLDFTKSIPLVSRMILNGPYVVKQKEDDFSYHEHIKDIKKEFEKYYPRHSSIRFSTNHKGLIEAQKLFEYNKD